jgi:hypothetical protein
MEYLVALSRMTSVALLTNDATRSECDRCVPIRQAAAHSTCLCVEDSLLSGCIHLMVCTDCDGRIG